MRFVKGLEMVGHFRKSEGTPNMSVLRSPLIWPSETFLCLGQGVEGKARCSRDSNKTGSNKGSFSKWPASLLQYSLYATRSTWTARL